MRMTAAAFETLVAEALDDLPPALLERLDNVHVVVDSWPTADQLASVGARSRSDLLGLYEGVPRTERTADYGLVTPDRITVFREPILRLCRTRTEARAEVQKTVVHELAHHFGIDDDRLEELGAY